MTIKRKIDKVLITKMWPTLDFSKFQQFWSKFGAENFMWPIYPNPIGKMVVHPNFQKKKKNSILVHLIWLVLKSIKFEPNLTIDYNDIQLFAPNGCQDELHVYKPPLSGNWIKGRWKIDILPSPSNSNHRKIDGSYIHCFLISFTSRPFNNHLMDLIWP